MRWRDIVSFFLFLVLSRISWFVRLIDEQGFRLRLVGHSLGGATAALLAIMLRELSSEQLGFSPDIVTAVTYAPPPCADKELAESCSDYVTTVVMQVFPILSFSLLIFIFSSCFYFGSPFS